jgi:ferric-dicitrate binding protein FerR (iron transport regulator)
MQEERFNILLEQYVTDMMNKEDRKEFLSLLKNPHYQSLLEKVMENEWNHGEYEEAQDHEIGQLIEQNVMEEIRGAKVVPIKQGSGTWLRKMVAVAAVLILIAGAYYLISSNSLKKEGTIASVKKERTDDVKQAGNNAVLTLGDGQDVILDKSTNGTITRQGGIRLDKTRDGLLSYVPESEAGEVVFNIVSTPKGGEYHLRLSDGTNVWLNAVSSLRFPAAFVGNERVVQVTGEAYFEVAHNAKKPFRVEVKGMQVQVLGTHFNINSYQDEGQSITTLVQGKIKITGGKASAILLPGQQALLTAENALSVVKHADLEEVLAWKNGYFKFNETEIEIAMKQIGRWYNLEVVYLGSTPNGHCTGKIGRNLSLLKLDSVLNGIGVHCKMEGKKITITP